MKKFLIAAAFAVISTTALAHSPLQSATPADGASIAEAPTEMVLVFRGGIRLTRVTLSHNDNATQDLDLSGQKEFVDRHTIALPDAGNGAYVLEWRGLSDDGHALDGTLVYYVE